MPRLGKIRLGIKAVSPKTGKEYPKEVDYFVVPPEVEKVYGPQPKELDIMFPVEDPSVIAPQAYEYYGSAKGLKCTGDGEYAIELNETTGVMERRECPCDKLDKGCTKRMHLRVVLPKVNIGGIYQIDTSSWNSIVDINSGIQYIKCATASPQFPEGRLAWIPLKLLRVPCQTRHDNQVQTHYTLSLIMNEAVSKAITTDMAVRFALPAPDVVEIPDDEDGTLAEEKSPKGIPESAVEERDPTPPVVYRTIKVRALVGDNIFPLLKSLGVEDKLKAERLLKTRLGVNKFEELNMKQAQAFMDFLKEWEAGACTVRWNESSLMWDIEYPSRS